MPGGRLTHQDRQRIASGLLDGVGYAEIARRLQRPTSTVSREVTRNGGPEGYRADQAHRAAARRARRHRAAAAPAASPIDGYRRDEETVRRFAETFTAVMVRTGLPPMAARVFVSLLICDAGELTAAELVERLRVSPASISKAVYYLEQVGCLTRVRDDRRRERYLIADDVWYQAWSRAVQAHTMWSETARAGAEALGIGTPAGARLAQVSTFSDLVARDIARAAEHWWQVLTARRRQHTSDTGQRHDVDTPAGHGVDTGLRYDLDTGSVHQQLG